jgi:hypothetical protein
MNFWAIKDKKTRFVKKAFLLKIEDLNNPISAASTPLLRNKTR